MTCFISVKTEISDHMISLPTEIWRNWECIFLLQWPAFGTRWVLAVLLFPALRIALITRGPQLGFGQQLGFLCCGPGMDLEPFHHGEPLVVARPGYHTLTAPFIFLTAVSLTAAILA